MEVSKEELKKAREFIDSIKIEKIEEILGKDVERLTEEDFKKIYEFKNGFRVNEAKFNMLYGKIIMLRYDIRKKIENYSTKPKEEKELEELEIILGNVENETEYTQIEDLLKIKEDRLEKIKNLLNKVGKIEIQYDRYTELNKEENQIKAMYESKIKDFIFNKENNDKCYWKIVKKPIDLNSRERDPSKRFGYITEEKGPVSEKIMKLIKDYWAFENKDETCVRMMGTWEDHVIYRFGRTIEFKSYDECNLLEKEKIKEKEETDKKKIEEILSDETGKYDKLGKIFIPYFDNEYSEYFNRYEREGYDQIGKIKIEITQRQLAEYGIVPEDINWKTMREAKKEERREARKISSKDIASASRGLTTKDVKGAKGALISLLDKFKNMFKGKE